MVLLYFYAKWQQWHTTSQKVLTYSRLFLKVSWLYHIQDKHLKHNNEVM